MWMSSFFHFYLVFLHGVFEVVVDAGDEVGVEPGQGEEDGRGGRGSERIHVPGELGPHPKCLVEETVSLWNGTETNRQILLTISFLWIVIHWEGRKCVALPVICNIWSSRSVTASSCITWPPMMNSSRPSFTSCRTCWVFSAFKVLLQQFRTCGSVYQACLAPRVFTCLLWEPVATVSHHSRKNSCSTAMNLRSLAFDSSSVTLVYTLAA